MNLFAIVILTALLADYLIGLLSDLLNMKTLKQSLPAEFEGIYDREDYRKSQDYTRTRIRFGIVATTFNLGILLVFWFSGGFNWLDVAVQAPGHGPVWTGLLYIGALMAGKSLLSLPFQIWSTFVIEEQYGFNRTTPITFVTDRIKGLLLSLILGGPLLAGIIALFQFSGAGAWIWAWAAITLFTLLIQFVAPTWIMPLFNRFDPLEEGELRDKIESYADKVSFPLQEVSVMDGSRRSGKSNAFFTGFGKNKRIALFDTLIEKQTPDELLAVVAHEVGHYKLKHIPKNMAIGILHTGLMLALLSLVLTLPGLFEAFYMDRMSIHAGLLFFGLLYSPAEMVLSVVMSALSRKHEFEADAWAARTTGRPEAMIQALKKLSLENLSHLTPHPLTVFLTYSHPPVLERIRAIKKIEKEDRTTVIPD